MRKLNENVLPPWWGGGGIASRANLSNRMPLALSSLAFLHPDDPPPPKFVNCCPDLPMPRRCHPLPPSIRHPTQMRLEASIHMPCGRWRGKEWVISNPVPPLSRSPPPSLLGNNPRNPGGCVGSYDHQRLPMLSLMSTGGGVVVKPPSSSSLTMALRSSFRLSSSLLLSQA
jgi:hypothetical protein